MNILEQYESEVRSYSRSWRAAFERAALSRLYTRDRTAYLDYFAGALKLARKADAKSAVRGRRLRRGLQTPSGKTASRFSAAAFERGFLTETRGLAGEVVKLMPPLTVSSRDIDEALDIIDTSVIHAAAAVGSRGALYVNFTGE